MTDLTTAPIMRVRLDGLVLDPATQIRTKTYAGNVKEYTEKMKAGVELPPITVARVDPKDETKGFVLIDGWHRVRASQAIGLTTISAKVTSETDPKRYRWIASEANRTHGIKLVREDRREVFRAYVQAGEHRHKNRGNRIKSAREMARDLQGIVSDRRIPAWMKQDFPSVYRAMLGGGLEENPGADFGRKDMDTRHAQLATASLDEFMACFRAIKSDEHREALLRQITVTAQEVAKATTGAPMLPVIVPHDEF